VIAVLVLLLASGGTVAAAGNSMPDEPLYPVKLATETLRLTLTPSALGKAELYALLAEKRVAEIINMAEKGKPEHVEQTARRLNAHLARIVSLAIPPGEEADVLVAPPPPAAVEETPAPSVEREPPEEETGVVMAPAPPAAVEEAPVAPERARAEDQGERVKLDKHAKLREIIIRNIAKHREKLSAALEKAPESARPALLRAIIELDAQYEEFLKVLRERGKD